MEDVKTLTETIQISYVIMTREKFAEKNTLLMKFFEKIICDKRFYETSGGGVTFSGGECMLQSDFLCDILKKCKESGVHTAIDTAGHISWKVFEKILCYTDLFLYDIKAFNNDIHRKYTGVSNELI